MTKLARDSDRLAFLDRSLFHLTDDFRYSHTVVIEGVFFATRKQWFFRKARSDLRSALLGFGYFSRPVRHLLVQFVGSQLEIEQLQEVGLEGNAISYNLHQFQFYHMGRSPESILPIRIELSEDSHEWNSMISSLRSEIQDVDKEVWEVLVSGLA